VLTSISQLEDALPSLADQGIQRLGPSPAEFTADGSRIDAALELKKLAKSLLLNFLELSGILHVNPATAAAKWDDIQTLFINMHHNINVWRPHQTREAVIAAMHSQLERTQGETKALREVTEQARRVLEGLGSVDEHIAMRERGESGAGDITRTTAFKEREVELWTALDALA
jgi:mediator of RNA polymerase II transcription subunit 7